MCVSANCTVLTKGRLNAILEFAKSCNADFIALQETKHPPNGFPFANRSAKEFGWSIVWSVSPPLMNTGARHPGGTALLWRKYLGRGTAWPNTDHRVCARSWANVTIASIYGPADGANLPWFVHTISAFEHLEQAVFLVGDYNWKNCYEKALTHQWAFTQHIPTVEGTNAAPTRAIYRHLPTSVNLIHNSPLAGIPHHNITAWSVPCLRNSNSTVLHRLKQCAKFQMTQEPSKEQVEWFETSAQEFWFSVHNSCGLPLQAPLDLNEANTRLRVWHETAEHICNLAASINVCSKSSYAEAPKGSQPAVRPITRKKVFCQEPVHVRRLKRLQRAAAECHRSGMTQLSSSQIRHWKAAVHDKLCPKHLSKIPSCQIEAIDIINRSLRYIDDQHQAQISRDWKKKFRFWNVEAMKATKSIFSTLRHHRRPLPRRSWQLSGQNLLWFGTHAVQSNGLNLLKRLVCLRITLQTPMWNGYTSFRLATTQKALPGSADGKAVRFNF